MSVALTQGGRVHSRNGVPAPYPIYAGMLVVARDMSSSTDCFVCQPRHHDPIREEDARVGTPNRREATADFYCCSKAVRPQKIFASRPLCRGQARKSPVRQRGPSALRCPLPGGLDHYPSASSRAHSPKWGQFAVASLRPYRGGIQTKMIARTQSCSI